MTTFSTKWEANSGTKFFIEGEKTGISNHPTGARAVTPSLIRPGSSTQTAKALVKGKWIEASNYLQSTPHIWNVPNPDHIWLALPDGWYATDRSCVVSFSREETIFTDGSILQGDFALWFYAGMQRIDHAILHFAKESESDGKVVFRQIGDKSRTLTAFSCQESPSTHRYSGGSGPVFNTPIVNATPYKIMAIKGYSTVANGWADTTIYSHPGCTLYLSSGGDAYSFSHWRDVPTTDKLLEKARTVLAWDEEHQEISVYEDALTHQQVKNRKEVHLEEYIQG